VLDCENRFDGCRLRDIVRTYILDKVNENAQGGFIRPQHPPASQLTSPSTEEIDVVVHAALARLYIFKPTSGINLLATILGLTSILSRSEDHEYHNIKDGTLGLICIDSLSSFHHVLRSTPPGLQQQYYHILSTTLRRLSNLFSIPVLVTSWSLFPQHLPDGDIPGGGRYIGTGLSRDGSSRRPIWKQYFPGEWTGNVDGRVILMKREIRGFVMGLGIEEAERERERRGAVVRRGEVVGWSESHGREFEMFITKEGVRVQV